MRMTVKQMQDKYPNTWLGISDVEHVANSRNIISAEVVYTDKTPDELAWMAVRRMGVQPFFTTPDDAFELGALS